MARYTDQARRPGELGAPEAAKALGLATQTLCRWGRDAIAGEASKISVAYVRQDIAGRYWFDAAEIGRLRKEAELARVGT